MNKRHPQNPEELKKLLEWVKDAESILEIGSRYGETLVCMARAMKGKKLVCVDLPNVEGWADKTIVEGLKANVEMLRKEGFDVDLILADSHDPETLKQVGGLFDVVFIDGDHSYEGVKLDWEMYGPLGKSVIFHDIVKQPPGRAQLGVWQLWEEIKGEEFIAPDSRMGIGRVAR